MLPQEIANNRATETSVSDSKGVKLTKLEVILWAILCVHNHTTLSISEKLVYL